MSHLTVRDARCDPNLVPLLDLVLQLIMFFIVCVSFKAQDYNSKDVQLPVVQSARILERSDDEPLFLNMDERGEVLIAGRDPLRTVPEMKDYLQHVYSSAQRVAKERGDKKIKMVIILRAHRGVDYESVYQLLRLCKDIGFTTLQLRAVKKGG